MAESCVVPAISATVNTTSSIAGSASEAIIISRDEPMPPNAVPTSMPASASAKRPVASSATMRDEIGRPGEHQVGGVGRHQRGGDPGHGEHEIGRGAIEPRGVVREHRLLVHAASRGRGRAARAAGRSRRSSRAFTLRVMPSTSGAIASTSSICTRLRGEIDGSAPCGHHQQQQDQRDEHQREIAADGQELELVERGRGLAAPQRATGP